MDCKSVRCYYKFDATVLHRGADNLALNSKPTAVKVTISNNACGLLISPWWIKASLKTISVYSDYELVISMLYCSSD